MFFKRVVKTSLLCLCSYLILLSLIACKIKDNGEWDALGGGGSGEIQNDANTENTDDLKNSSDEIITNIDNEQKEVNHTGGIEITEALKIEEPGEYKISGTINGQINVKSQGVKLFLDNCTIINIGKKVISSDYDLIIILVEDTQNTIINTAVDAVEANAISGSGKITINGSGKLTISSTKSGIKADGIFYGLGGSLVISAGTGHGISADACILTGGSITVNSAAKDGIHAETEDAVLEVDPVFDSSRGFVYIGGETNLTLKGILGDGIQSDTYVLIDGGNINISTIPTFIKATSSDSCYKLSGGVYTKVAAEDSKNYSNLYQLQQSSKGIKVGEIDYTVDNNEYVILENTAYSLIIAGGVINISSTDDGLHTNSGNLLISEGTISIETSDDGIAADKNLKITDGTIIILKSYEGLEGETIDIMGGFIKLTSIDDGINASSDESTAVQKTKCYIKISGGIIYVNSSGDGVDSNGGVQISGGELYISGPTSGADASLDSETGIVVTGGIVIALGSSGMVETPASNSTAYCVSINLSSIVSDNVAISLNSNILISFSPVDAFGVSKNYQSLVIICPDFVKGQTYSVTSGTKTTSVTISGVITKVGQTAGPGKK